MSEARVRVSLTDRVLEFEGPEPFVAGLVEKFGAVIQAALGGEQPDASASRAADRRFRNQLRPDDTGRQASELVAAGNLTAQRSKQPTFPSVGR